jgi:enoyl-CoA hydratase/carnithine racemase
VIEIESLDLLVVVIEGTGKGFAAGADGVWLSRVQKSWFPTRAVIISTGEHVASKHCSTCTFHGVL